MHRYLVAMLKYAAAKRDWWRQLKSTSTAPAASLSIPLTSISAMQPSLILWFWICLKTDPLMKLKGSDEMAQLLHEMEFLDKRFCSRSEVSKPMCNSCIRRGQDKSNVALMQIQAAEDFTAHMNLEITVTVRLIHSRTTTSSWLSPSNDVLTMTGRL